MEALPVKEELLGGQKQFEVSWSGGLFDPRTPWVKPERHHLRSWLIQHSIISGLVSVASEQHHLRFRLI